MLSRAATYTNFIVFGFEPTITLPMRFKTRRTTITHSLTRKKNWPKMHVMNTLLFRMIAFNNHLHIKINQLKSVMQKTVIKGIKIDNIYDLYVHCITR